MSVPVDANRLAGGHDDLERGTTDLGMFCIDLIEAGLVLQSTSSARIASVATELRLRTLLARAFHPFC